ncbi:P-loop containing nucleoside triphosphate hydrolase protein [Corynespora cassiicola Philippines]|uniref:P-loop containing nucleoside triphosphate hydrolase protein n=1 Tax=Corynespora cassiicola Philippines TaxID=1448308 RepID=A0A2T2N661_CORCC|nr:P-loop containing nucleoside triphosphate hydrolase protein [Corynespora cassiicola Philippines]
MADGMVDDKRLHALVSAVASNMDRLRQTINALRQLHDRWRDSSGTSINLIAQLTALKSNLAEMQDWMNCAIDDMHTQLLMDLEMLMTSCSLLVRNLDGLIAQLRQPDHDNTDCAVKLKLTLGSRSMDRLRAVAKRQTDAVSLLLAACKCHTTAQRKILLHKSRQIRKEDASSLNTLVRTSRWNARCINTLTHVSRMIQWFRLLFYIKLCRGHHDQGPTEQDYLDAAAVMRSEAIDRRLEEDATTLRRETKVILMGQVNSGKELIMRQMKVIYAEGYPKDERISYRYAIRSTLRLLIHSMIDLIKDTGINLPSDLSQDFAVLLYEVETIELSNITPAAVHAVENLWHSPQFSTLYVKNFEIDFPQYSPYFVHEVGRIAADDYVPTEADIIRLNQSLGGIKELRFTWDDLDVHLFNISGFIPGPFRKRWFHQLEGATALIYTVDVSTYDRPYFGQPTESQLLNDFATFESWANSPKFSGSSIILLLNNFTRFKEKLQHSSLSTFFPEYRPGDNPETSARQYILRRFKDVNRNQLSIYSFWVDLDMSDNQHLYAALKKTLHHIQQRKARSEVWEQQGASPAGDSLARTGTAASRSGATSKNDVLSSPLSDSTVAKFSSSSRG